MAPAMPSTRPAGPLPPGVRLVRLWKGQSTLFAPSKAPPVEHHEGLAQQDDLVLLRSRTNPKVRRWQHTQPQATLFHTDPAERFLRELERAGSSAVALTRARAESPHVHHLFTQGLIHLETLPIHFVTPFRASLTDAGRRYLRMMADREKAQVKQAQRPLFKAGDRMRVVILHKAPRKVPPGPRTAAGTTHVEAHFAKNAHGAGTHVVLAHERKTLGHLVEEPKKPRAPSKKKKAEPVAEPAQEGRTFEVPTHRLEDLHDQFAALAKRADRLGVEAPRLTVGTNKTMRQTWKVTPATPSSPQTRKKGGMVETVTVTIHGPEVKLKGWNVAAVVEPRGKGVLIKTQGAYGGQDGVKVPERYHKGDSCEHCNTERKRNKLFVIHNPAQKEWKRVGGECLKDHTGRSADSLTASLAFCEEFLDAFDGFGFDEGEDGGGGGRKGKGLWFPRPKALGWALRAAGEGLISRTVAEETGVMSTGDLAREYAINGATIRPQDKADAAEVAKFWAGVKEAEVKDNDFLRNVWVVLQDDHISFKDIPLVAWSRRAMERVAENRQRLADQAKAAAEAPPPLGKPGDKIKAGKVSSADKKAGVEYHAPRIVLVDRTHVHPGDYGSTTFMTMHDADGHVIEWGASGTAKEFNLPPGPDGQQLEQWYFNLDRAGQQLLLRGASIDSHTEYKGVKRTKIKRADVVPYFKDERAFVEAAIAAQQGHRAIPAVEKQQLEETKNENWERRLKAISKGGEPTWRERNDAFEEVRKKHDALYDKVVRANLSAIYKHSYLPMIDGYKPLLKGRRVRLGLRALGRLQCA